MSPRTANDSPSFDEVCEALQVESSAPEEAAEKATADPPLHVEVEKEGARGLGNRVQPLAPEFSDAADMAAHQPDALATTQPVPTALTDMPIHAAATRDRDLLRASLDPGSDERRPRGRG